MRKHTAHKKYQPWGALPLCSIFICLLALQLKGPWWQRGGVNSATLGLLFTTHTGMKRCLHHLRVPLKSAALTSSWLAKRNLLPRCVSHSVLIQLLLYVQPVCVSLWLTAREYGKGNGPVIITFVFERLKLSDTQNLS